MKVISKETDIGGRKLRLEVGRFAPLATASVLAQYGETMVLATVVAGASKEELGYFPLSVEYIERLYAGGKIKGSRWVKREGRPSDEAVLTGRLIDRSIRPLFPKDFYNEIQVTITVLSVDLENDPDVLSIVATSAALAISDIPWSGPIGAVKVGLKENTPFLNPVEKEMSFSDLDLVVSATKERVLMIEGGARQVPDEAVVAAIGFGKEESQKVIALIEELQKEAGKPKSNFEHKEIPTEIKEATQKFVKEQLDQIFNRGKEKKEVPGSAGQEEIKNAYVATFEEGKKEAASAFDYFWKKIFRDKMLSGARVDGRSFTEIRPIDIEVGILPRTHGSALFRRGLTQVLSVATLGAPSLSQLIESATGEESKRYMHHYSMPPYSTGEVGRIGNLSRREIGHGALAERAVEPVMPEEAKFPYTVRVVSEVMSSNGSTSMGSTCGSILALMDAGVPIVAPVAGIAMGLVTGSKAGADGDYKILTDIAGIEDFNGDMDFKITGTEKGITAIQLDVKIPGLTDEMIEEIVKQAKEGRLFILDKIQKAISAPREKISQYAPKIVVMHIDQAKIGEVIGPGGRIIRKLIEITGCNIEVEDDGSINISGISEESVNSAVEQIKGLVAEAVPGQIYDGEVKRIQPFGAFVEILPGKEGLVHVSQMGTGFVSNPEQVVSLGQKVKVKVMEIDDKGRINLTMLLNGEKKEGMGGSGSGESRPQRSFRPPQRPEFRKPGGFSSRLMPQSRFGR